MQELGQEHGLEQEEEEEEEEGKQQGWEPTVEYYRRTRTEWRC